MLNILPKDYLDARENNTHFQGGEEKSLTNKMSFICGQNSSLNLITIERISFFNVSLIIK
jgi:hypothetical protein